MSKRRTKRKHKDAALYIRVDTRAGGSFRSLRSDYKWAKR